MYKLVLTNFRSVENKTLEIPANGVILLDGPSGVGKTTILSAISFVLYDDSNFSPISQVNEKKKKSTSVELRFPNEFIVFRQKNPAILRVQYKNEFTLMDAAATEYIQKSFGNLAMWETGGYLRQGQLCEFLRMSASEKMSFLQELSPSNSSANILKNLDEAFTKNKKLMDEAQMAYDCGKMYCASMTSSLSSSSKNIQQWTLQDLQKISPDVQEISCNSMTSVHLKWNMQMSERVAQNDKQRMQRVSEEALLKKSIEQKERFRVQLESLAHPTEMHELQKELSDIQKSLANKKIFIEREHLLHTQKELQSSLKESDPPTYSLSDLSFFANVLNIGTREFVLSEYEIVCKSLKQREFNLLRDQRIGLYQHLKREDLRLEKTLSTLSPYPDVDTSDDHIHKLQSQITFSQNIQALKCPKCTTPVYLSSSGLTIWDTSEFQKKKEELDKCKSQKEYEKLQRAQKGVRDQLDQLPDFSHVTREHSFSVDLYSQYTSLYSHLADINFNIPEKYANADLHLICNRLQHLMQEYEKIPAHMTLQEISRQRELHAIAQEKSQIQIKLQKIENRLKDLLQNEGENRQEEISELEKRETLLIQMISRKTEWNYISQEMKRFPADLEDQLKNTLLQIQILDTEKNELQKEIFRMNEELRIQMTLLQIQEKLAQMENIRLQISALEKKQQSLHKIRAVIMTAEYVLLDTVLSSLNSSIAEILESLFADPITVELKSLRQLKSTDRVKPEIHIDIHYRNVEFPNLRLSGGEASRLSLALLVAFSKLSKSPFILLDESLSTLDAISKENAMTVIREHCGQKVCLAVNHDTQEGGNYDSVIRL